jgi:hypothetical protein
MPKLTPARYEENFPGANFTDDEIEFLKAMENYKRKFSRPFPSWHEVLKVILELGYHKDPPRPRVKPIRDPSE